MKPPWHMLLVFGLALNTLGIALVLGVGLNVISIAVLTVGSSLNLAAVLRVRSHREEP